MIRLSLASVAILIAAQAAFGQAGGTGSIQGTITDPSGALIARAEVTAKNIATGVETMRKTAEAGLYSIQLLAAGTYRLTVKASGFQTLVQENVVVAALSAVGVNVAMTVGSSSQSVTVESTPAALRTDDATLGSSIDNAVYSALPLAMNGVARDPTQCTSLVAGVAAYVPQAAGPSTGSFNGGQPYQNEIYLEGLPLTNAGTEGDTRNLALGISVEAVEQFQIETNGSKAMYEGQGVGNFVLKSGTNSFHGGVYEYFRNTALDARGFFPPSTPVEHQNEFGGKLGGPIKKNKIFFFGNYDGYRFVSATVPTLQTVPTLAFRDGNFGALPAALYDPATTQNAGTATATRLPFAGNIVPANRISPVAKSLQSYLPNPTNANITNNYLTQLPNVINIDNMTAKVDVNWSDRNRFFGLYSTGKYATGKYGSPIGTLVPEPYTTARQVTEYPTTTQFHDTFVVSPTVVNQLSFSFSRIYIPLVSLTAEGNYPQKAGIKGLPGGLASSSFPDVIFNGTNVPNAWANIRVNVEAANTYTLQNNVIWSKGRHSFTFGYQWQALQDNFNNPLTGTFAAFTFSNNETANFNGSAVVATTGNAYASYLLGAVNASSTPQSSVAETGGRYKTNALYVQDDIKVTPKLTVNLGLRWDIFGTFREVVNRMSFFDPNLANPAVGGRPGALNFAGSGPGTCNCSTPVRTHFINPGPRIGVAYSLTPKTVLRAGYSIVYVHAGGVGGRVNSRQGLSQLGFNSAGTTTSTVTGVPAYYIDNGVPQFAVPPFLNAGYGSGNIVGSATPQALTYGDPAIGGKPPYYENWSFSVQRSLTNSLVATFAYTASAGHFLPGAGNASQFTNQIPSKYLPLGSLLTATYTPASLALAQAQFPEVALPYPNFTGTISSLLRPYPQYGTIANPWANVGNSSYHAGQFTLNHRFAHGVSTMVGYTFSKELDNLVAPRNPYNTALEKAPGAVNRPHVMNATFVYLLPFGADRKFKSGHSAVNQIIGGWQLSGVVNAASGAPLIITATNCQSGNILGTCYPNYNPSFSGDARINGNFGDGNVATTPYLNKAAFVVPAPYTVGNVARSAALGLNVSHVTNFDLSVHRDFKIREHWRLSLQSDAFNILNSVYFGAPGTNIDAANFGLVTSQSNLPRRLQLSARITF